MSDKHKNFCLVTGISEETDRSEIKRVFGKFGTIKKIFIKEGLNKVYFDDPESCVRAVRGLKNNSLGWTVEESSDKPYQHFKNNFQNVHTFGESHTTSRADNFSTKSKMNDTDYLDEEFVENAEYCDIHGNPLVVFQADTGDVYVNVKDVRRAGFSIYRKDTFNPLLVDKRQIQKEFELHLLSEAKNYILKNKAVSIDEEHILRTIERCKSKLLGDQSYTENHKINRTVRNEQSTGGFNSFDTSSNEVLRPPKTLPNRFTHNATPRNTKTFAGNHDSQSRGRLDSNREIRETNGFNDDSAEKRTAFNQNRKPNQNYHGNSNRSRSKSRYSDDVSQTSDNSEKRMSFAELEAVDKIGKVELEVGSSYDVTVSHIQKDNIYWVQEKESAVDLENILIKLFDLAPELEEMSNPALGQLCLAMFEDVWCRARVLNKSPLYVHYLDYGNRSRPESVKVFPEELRKFPALALRITLGKSELQPTVDSDLNVKVKTQYSDGTYLVDAEKSVEMKKPSRTNDKPERVANEKPEVVKELPEKVKSPTKSQFSSDNTPTEVKNYFGVPKPLTTLKHDDKVMLIDIIGNRFAVKTKECVQKSKELLEHIKNLDKSNLLLTDIKEGQLVLCSKDGLPNLYRAVVVKMTSPVAANVKYLDCPGEDQLSIKSLRNVDDFLSKQPVTLLLSPEYEKLNKVSEKTAEFIWQLVDRKEKFKVALREGSDFDLQLEDGTLLGDKIVELEKKEKDREVPKLVPATVENPPEKAEPVKSPPPKTDVAKAEPPAPKVEESVPKPKPQPSIVTYDDMDWIKPEIGATDDFLCYTIKDLQDLTLFSLQEESITHMEKVTDINVDDEPYEPKEFEMCLVAYKGPEDEEKSWYRGVVFEIKDNGVYNIQAVDYGNFVDVKSNDIRRFGKDLKDIPILGITCELVGIPNNDSVLERVKQLIPEGEQVTAKVKGFEELKYQIEIPDVYEKLKKEGLF